MQRIIKKSAELVEKIYETSLTGHLHFGKDSLINLSLSDTQQFNNEIIQAL